MEPIRPHSTHGWITDSPFWGRQTAKSMWRAFFYAVGIMLVVLGVECLVIDSAMLHNGNSEEMVQNNNIWSGSTGLEGNRVIKPAEWQPWSFLASGSIVLLYSLTIKKGDH